MSVTINVGVVPLLLSPLGLIRIIISIEVHSSGKIRKTVAITRFPTLIGVGFLVAGAVLASISSDAKRLDAGNTLVKTGSFILAVLLSGIVAFGLLVAQCIAFELGARISRSTRLCAIAIA